MMTQNHINLHCFQFVVFVVTILNRVESVTASCELSFKANNKLYDYNLVAPIAQFPHGVRSEDGFYKVVANGTILWFQLCDEMIYNHDPPSCVDCKDCGGPSHCGMGCSALVAQSKGGYPVCTTVGLPSSTVTGLIDVNNPQTGITVTMSNNIPPQNCSVKVSIICDSKRFQAPQTIEKVGACDYVTQLSHPSGCAHIMYSRGQGWGWFGTLILIIVCLFGAYILAGAIYRYFHLGIRGIDVIPNWETWASILHKVQSFFMSLIQRFRGPYQGYRSSYSPVHF